MSIIKDIYNHIKYTRILNKVYKEEKIIRGMSELLNSEIHQDWVGRLYTVLNPNLIPREEQVFELSDNKLDNKAFVEKWVMEHFIVMERFIKANNLFDLLTYRLDKIDEYDNYLLVIEPITFSDFKSSIKKLCVLLPITLTLLIIGCIFI